MNLQWLMQNFLKIYEAFLMKNKSREEIMQIIEK